MDGVDDLVGVDDDPSRSHQPPVGPSADGTAMAPQSGPPPAPSAPGKRHRPWGWIAACVVLLLVAAVDGAKSKLAALKDQFAQSGEGAGSADGTATPDAAQPTPSP